MTDRDDLKDFVDPSLTEAALSQQWRRIERRLGAARTQRPFLAFALAACAALSLAVVVSVMHFRKTAPASAWDGAELASGKDGVSVGLSDGSRIELEPESRILVREGSVRAVHLEMPKGGARFEVTHVKGRVFDVTALGIRVHVVGTRFTVKAAHAAEGERVSVSVEEGVVEVERVSGGERTRVRAGETFSTVTEEDGDKRSARAIAPSQTAESAPEPAKTAEPEPEPSAHASVEPKTHVVEADSAQELFEKGNAARRAGDPRGAATTYEALLRKHPTDARAGLAAFELGRLRMDQLGDLKGATVALERAAATAPGFREDALARLVSAYGTLGDQARCERARSAYLGSHPNGVHAAAVQKACGHGP